MRRAAAWVARKELLEILRDRRSLAVLILLPVLLYPALCIGVLLAATAQLRRLAAETHLVWVEDAEALPPGLRASLEEELPEEDAGPGGASRWRLRLEPLPEGADVDGALVAGRVHAVLRGTAELGGARSPPPPRAGEDGDGPTLDVLYNEGIDASRLTMRRVSAGVSAWSRRLARERVRAAGLPVGTLEPVASRAVDRGPPGALLARLLGAVLVILALTGAYYPALDLGAGEKERGTLETLLLAPVPRVAIALGKYAAVLTVAGVCAVLHLLSLGATTAVLGAAAPEGLALRPDPWLALPVLAALLPLVALFSAAALAVSTFAASYKEGQAYLTPLVLVGTVPPLAAALPGVQLEPVLALVPVLGAALLVKGLLVGTAQALDAALVIGSSAAYAALAVRWVASLYDREEVLWRPAAAPGPDLLGLRPRREGEARPTLPQAAALGGVSLLLVWSVGVPAQGWHPVAGVAVTLIALVALPALAYARLLGCGAAEAFALRRPSGAALAAAVLLGAGAVALNLDLAWLQRSWSGPLTPAERREVAAATEAFLALPAPLLYALLALLPALCEELLFRGFVLQGLRRGGGAAGAVLVSSLLFALAHLDPARLLPTFAVGLLLGAVVVRSGSLWPAMLLHATYDAAVVTAERWGLLEGWLTDGHPTWGLRAVAWTLAAVGAGVLLASRRAPTGTARE